MKLTTNIMLFHNELGVYKTVDVFAKAGFDGIEFNADLKEYHNGDHDEAFYKGLRTYAEDRGIPFTQAHAPFGSAYVDEEKTRQRFLDITASIKHVSWLGVPMIIVHPATHLEAKTEEGFARMMEYNIDFYRRLIPYAEEYGVKIAIENIPGAVTEAASGLLSLVDALKNDAFTICYDVGHAHIRGQGAADMIRALGNRIGCTHIHDNDGVHDSHTRPFYGTIHWESVMQAVAEVGYEGNLNYEAGVFVKNMPVTLRQESADYMAVVGKHLIGRYHHYKSVNGGTV